MKRYIDEEVVGYAKVSVACPNPKCNGELSLADVGRLSSASVRDRLEQAQLKAALQAMPDFRWCTHPGCDCGQVVEGAARNPIFTCQACKHKSCFIHKVPWHEGYTCRQYDAHLQESSTNEAADQKYIKQKCQLCPKCELALQKAGGCDHFVCQKPLGCGSQFCWVCGADYPKILQYNNSFHKKTCRYYTMVNG